MQGEPFQFGAVAASRANRSAAGFALPTRSVRNVANETKAASVLDEAFADFTRVDAGPSSHDANKSVPQNWPSMTQALIANIATQLETLDSQRRQLTRLLDGVNSAATV
jgi:hypothetical protein